MLREVLRAVQAREGGTDIRALSRELGIERGALKGMIDYWVRKGRLVDSDAHDVTGPRGDSRCVACSPRSCAGAHACPFVVRVPRSVTVPLGERATADPGSRSD